MLTGRTVLFEDSGRSDRAYERAAFVEHLSVWHDAHIPAAAFLDRFELGGAETARVRVFRRLFAFFWLLMLLPDGPAHDRNLPGTLDRQAGRLLELLG
jgi:hypothetical protein